MYRKNISWKGEVLDNKQYKDFEFMIGYFDYYLYVARCSLCEGKRKR